MSTQHTCTNEWAQAPEFLWCAVCGRTLTDEETALIREEVDAERERAHARV